MTKYFIEGGPLFMGMLTIVLLVVIAIAVRIIVKPGDSTKVLEMQFTAIRHLSLLGLVLGMLGQFIGLFTAFELIGSGVQVSPAMMAGGVKVSMITTIYGMIIFIVGYLLLLGLKFLRKEA